MARRSLLLCLFTLLVMSVLSVPAHAVTWGATNGGGTEHEGHLQARSIGVTTMREDVHQTGTGISGWPTNITEHDGQFLLAAQDGVRLMPLLFGPPASLPGGGLPADPTTFAEFTAATVKRFGPRGDFWLIHPELDSSLAPTHFELWNEPNYSYFGGSTDNAGRYARLVKASVAAGRQTNTSARFLVYGGDSTWVSSLFRATPDIGSYMDAMSVHPGGRIGNCKTVYCFRSVEAIRANLLKRGLDLDFWITEHGYTTSEAQQVDLINQATDIVRQEWQPWLRAYYYFQISDWSPNYSYGLFRLDGSPKPAAIFYDSLTP